VITASAPYIDFHGWEWVHDNIECNPDQITGASEVVMATTGELKDVLPYLSNSWYDNLAFSPALDQLFNVNSTYQYPIELSLCTGADIFMNDTWSEYTFDLRSGVMFHDGHVMDADDVVYSYAAAMFHPASYDATDYLGVIGDDISFKWLNGTTTRLVFNATENMRYYPADATTVGTKFATIEAVDSTTVKVSGTDISPIYHPERTGDLEIVPKHVLETIPLEEWDSHTFNTGEGSYDVNGHGFDHCSTYDTDDFVPSQPYTGESTN
jgi:ABC-type transport system substrate-binding protein